MKKGEPRQIVKKSKCFVCNADVYFKKSTKNTVYYACNGETSATSCGTRLFFGERPSHAMLNQQQPVEENHVRLQSGGNPVNEKPAVESQPEPAAGNTETVDQGKSSTKQRGYNPAEFWNLSN